MLTFQNLGNISPIILTIIVLVYLIAVELGNKRIRKALIPFVIILVIIFLIIAVINIYSTYMGVK